jgi:hypothetical protein
LSLLIGGRNAHSRNVLSRAPDAANDAPKAAADPSADAHVAQDQDQDQDHDDEDSEPPPAWIGHLKLPFGPFLALGALEHLFYGDVLIDKWLELSEALARLIGIGV